MSQFRGDDLRFWTTLLKVRSHTDEGLAALRANCKHVADDYWIMEGDTDYLRDEGIRFKEVAEGAVPGLGDLTERELREVCRDSFGVVIP